MSRNFLGELTSGDNKGWYIKKSDVVSVENISNEIIEKYRNKTGLIIYDIMVSLEWAIRKFYNIHSKMANYYGNDVYKNVTGNLSKSIGAAVYLNGKMYKFKSSGKYAMITAGEVVKITGEKRIKGYDYSGNMKTIKTSKGEGDWVGEEEAIKALKSYRPKEQGICSYVVIAMPYGNTSRIPAASYLFNIVKEQIGKTTTIKFINTSTKQGSSTFNY